MKNKLDTFMDKLDNPLFTTIRGEDVELMATLDFFDKLVEESGRTNE